MAESFTPDEIEKRAEYYDDPFRAHPFNKATAAMLRAGADALTPKKCATCRWWDRSDRLWHLERRACIAPEFPTAFTYTLPTFGCVLHVRKDGQ